MSRSRPSDTLSPPLEIERFGSALGAEVRAVDLSQPLDGARFEDLHRAFLEHHVLVFRDQKLSHADQLAFARRFGELDRHPIVDPIEEHPELVRVWKPAGESASFGTGWHTDNSFFEHPSMATLLYGVTLPPRGGDTLFASMEAAWEALSDTMKGWLAPLVAVHSASRAYAPSVTGDAKYRGEAAMSYTWSEAVEKEVTHPVMRTHPETGRASLYVNPMFTQRIVGLEAAESRALLAFIYRHCQRPEFQVRVRWQPGSLALWDNRAVQHNALDDYREYERLLYRATICGDKPV